MTTDDALSAYVRQHAEQALLGLARFEYSTGEAIQREMTVEVVHATRTSLRRLRAVLRTFPESFPVPGPADDDLRFVARALSDVRDTDVLSQALLGEVDALPESLVLGPARQDLARALAARRRRAIEAVDRDRIGPSWGRAVELLGTWQQTPPHFVEPPSIRRLKEARDEVRRRVRDSQGAPEALHSARKAAKRWRYAAELLLPVEPKAAKHFDRATEFHVLLGELQDAVVATEFLRDHAQLGNRSGHNGFTTGLLHASAQQRLEAAASRALSLA